MDGGNNGRQAGQQAGWVFSPGGAGVQSTDAPRQSDEAQKSSVEWTASEYVAHEKHTAWYVQVLLATVVVAALVYLITRDVISSGIIVFAGVVFAVAAARKPRVLAYRVDAGGLTVGQKYYPYTQFKSFAVMAEGSLATVVFMPHKRFAPSIDVYVPPENANAIIAVISGSLPIVNRKQGMVDTITNRIRF
ncbi:MAG: hypothetical protein ACREGD_04495 [Candidatus Saccharimonadales bacterium]